MKPEKLGIVSALVASVCCVGPMVLVLLGLGSLGVGAVLGRYHWWFILVAIGLLTYAWRSYVKEAYRCRTEACEMARGKTTRTALILASGVVALFVGLNVYTYASQSRGADLRMASPGNKTVISTVIPVEGMTCFTCELTVESSLKRLSGVQSVDAKVNERAAYVMYDPNQIHLEQLIAAINQTGFRASRPSDEGGGI